MEFFRDVILIFLLGLYVQQNNIDLANNQTILFLLLLILILNSRENELECNCCYGCGYPNAFSFGGNNCCNRFGGFDGIRHYHNFGGGFDGFFGGGFPGGRRGCCGGGIGSGPDFFPNQF